LEKIVYQQCCQDKTHKVYTCSNAAVHQVRSERQGSSTCYFIVSHSYFFFFQIVREFITNTLRKGCFMELNCTMDPRLFYFFFPAMEDSLISTIRVLRYGEWNCEPSCDTSAFGYCPDHESGKYKFQGTQSQVGELFPSHNRG
jgi:hypothetical protein